MKVKELLACLGDCKPRFYFSRDGEGLAEVWSTAEAVRLYGDEEVVSYEPLSFFFEREHTGLKIELAAWNRRADEKEK